MTAVHSARLALTGEDDLRRSLRLFAGLACGLHIVESCYTLYLCRRYRCNFKISVSGVYSRLPRGLTPASEPLVVLHSLVWIPGMPSLSGNCIRYSHSLRLWSTLTRRGVCTTGSPWLDPTSAYASTMHALYIPFCL